MASEKLKYLSESSLYELRSAVVNNLELYRSEDFFDVSSSNGWSINSDSVFVDSDRLSSLNGDRGASSDFESSITVYLSLIHI